MRTGTAIRAVPRLRFAGFEDEWRQIQLGDIASFSKGKGIPKKDLDPNGDRPCVLYGELYTIYGAIIDSVRSATHSSDGHVLSEGGELLMPASGETREDIATASFLPHEGVAIGGDLNILKTEVNGAFLANYLRGALTDQLIRLAQGNSVVHLYAPHISSVIAFLPSPAEQRKIADFLAAVDRRIELLRRKKALLETWKRGVMQKIFDREVRFTREDGTEFPEWEEVRLSDLAEHMQSGGTPKATNRSYYGGPIPFLSISDMSEQGKYLRWATKGITEEAIDNSSTWIVPPGRLIYSMYASVGLASINKIPIATSQAVMNIQFNEAADVEYMYYYLDNYRPKIRRLIETGVQGNINKKIVERIPVNIPVAMEQLKIAEGLRAVDKGIDLVQQELGSLEKWKRGLLQNLFV